MSDHELHCDCRIELLRVTEERDTACRETRQLAEDLRWSALEREKQRIKTSRLREGIRAHIELVGPSNCADLWNLIGEPHDF